MNRLKHEPWSFEPDEPEIEDAELSAGLGAAAGIAMITGAIRLRRWRDEG